MSHTKFVICIDNADYAASLEKRKIYGVVPDPAAEAMEHVRIIDESGEDYLYPASYFIDVNLPESTEAAIINAA